MGCRQLVVPPNIMLTTTTTFLSHTIIADQSQTLVETLIGFLPIVLFLLILWFLFRKQQKTPLANLQKEYLTRQLQHMARIEELLERIAKALERNQ